MNPELKKWCEQAEKIRTESAREYYKLYVGLKYNPNKIHQLERESLKHSLFFLKKFKEPKDLISECVGSVAGAKTHKLSLKLEDLRMKKICSVKHKFKEKPVCWTSWRTFVVNAPDKARKEVYDEFIKKTPIIAPTIKKTFEKCKKIYFDYGLNPLTEYLDDHKISLNHLKSTLIELREGVRKKYKKEFSHYTEQFLGREPRYYDDFYFMRNIVFENMTSGFKSINPLAQINKTLKQLGFNPSKIKVDSTERPKKAPSPFCMMAKIPGDIRVSYKMENPLNTTNAIFHEFGHAIHGTSIDPKLPYWVRYGMSGGLCETFSIFFEKILLNKNYLTKELKLPPDYADEFIRKTNFTDLYSVAFYTGNSLFKIKYWEKEFSFSETSEEYAKEIKKSMGLDIPGEYWMLHHILPETLIAVPNYMLADMNVAKLQDLFENEFGQEWWKNKKAGKQIYELMKPGKNSPLGDFSKINPKTFLRRLGC
ncbi:MAG: hypothetical protein QW666_04595 [Candidatus Woesearchaeota archaeon]